MSEGMMRIVVFLLLLLPSSAIPYQDQFEIHSENRGMRELIKLKSGADDLLWVVQLSDLHFSVHHPERAADFDEIIGPTLSFVNPSLVFLTGDLTDGKSKDMLTMKQDEEEWIEYQKVMDNVVKTSGLNESIFHDVRGNHDNFGVPDIGGSYDFFSKYSFNGKLRGGAKVNSITIQTRKRKVLFVGFDSTMSSGLRGPTNLFGHPTDELLTNINSELSQWDSQSTQPVTKLSFGHFPLSFSAATTSGKTLKDVFLMNSLSAYVCGHLHAKFGKNLKRHHYLSQNHVHSKQLFQLNGHHFSSDNSPNCSNSVRKINEFWEWEMGDWRSSRSIRILAVDGGHLSFVDTDFKLGARKTIILPTFPLDSRFMLQSFDCGKAETTHGEVRALVFSASPIISVVARIYDSSSGNLHVVMETPMTKLEMPRNELYVAPWNAKAFEDPSPERFLLQIEATDITGRSTTSDLRPFSVTGTSAKLPWTWKEFFVMGCQWDDLYYPIFWFFYLSALSILLIPRVLLSFSGSMYIHTNFNSSKGFINGMIWIFMELYNFPIAWFGIVGYLFFLLLSPWFYGRVFTEDSNMGYMTYRGWALRFDDPRKLEFQGFPDVMVVVLPHLYFVLFPAIVVIMALVAERGIRCTRFVSFSNKKNDDTHDHDKEVELHNNCSNQVSESTLLRCWLRKFLLVLSMAICWRHFKNCLALTKAYEISVIIIPFYSLTVPLLLIYTVWKTGKT